MLSLDKVAAIGCLVFAGTIGSVVAAEVPGADLLVPLQVVEPARWLVEKPGTERWEEASVRVSYSELDLSAAAGVSELYERLQRASERVCERSTRAQRGSSSEMQLCISGVLAKAVAEVNLSRLAEKHAG